ncbi:coproporphyrinogen-III oxidase [Thermaurantimonas aggregans]|uniref:Coproporphyrinogen-III oxidase n=1 Tax=Thermaurantimonas aggregans TaxID=2173829 RepID=A0A401XMT1_9FLAO|nr:oxygen-independent coproporphyrinogen III oxidase [Thermaurantimonas aggregans]MCX8149385.1 oxygen-independent coproporphyrinogen III oxidase [Thermaurantimonas aggregans]GCD78320.1 coproporphyrinogen-III oxidase [Thermaurantimonas aggregans]
MSLSIETIIKYERPLPRYTSYPTVPFWDAEHFDAEKALGVLRQSMLTKPDVSIYIHLPYCESLCTFCGCNRRITKNHTVEQPYIDAILEEWRLYQLQMPQPPVITHIHLGGGTPTFFSPSELKRLIDGIVGRHKLSPIYEFSIEVHPNTCTYEHIDVLADIGFRRISVGIQDFDPRVQYIINRNQTFEKTRDIIEYARFKGFAGVNVDLVYGLPLQTVESIKHTTEKIAELMPDRIAYYAYAHVPWKSKAQRRYTEADLPSAREKIQMFLSARERLKKLGYEQIAMDHFALPNDSMTKAWHSKSLHRNFMGYTTDSTPLLIGLGASSISDFNGNFAQNYKEVEKYLGEVKAGKLPIERGHLSSEMDKLIADYIMQVMCTGMVKIPTDALSKEHLEFIANQLQNFIEDGILTWEGESLQVTELGQLLLRNIAAVFDTYLFYKGLKENMFSKSV